MEVTRNGEVPTTLKPDFPKKMTMDMRMKRRGKLQQMKAYLNHERGESKLEKRREGER